MADEALTPCTYAQAAETTRHAMGGMVVEVARILDGCDISQVEAVAAIAEGSLAHAVDVYLRLHAVFSVPLGEVRESLNRAVHAYWMQSLAAHYTEKGKRAAWDKQGEL
jgi:hypothetical protein